MSEITFFFVLALLFGATGWAAFGLALLRQRHLVEEADRLACRVVDQGEQIGRLRQDLKDVQELAEYRARLIQRLPVGPAAVRPVGERVEAPSYLVRKVPDLPIKPRTEGNSR